MAAALGFGEAIARMSYLSGDRKARLRQVELHGGREGDAAGVADSNESSKEGKQLAMAPTSFKCETGRSQRHAINRGQVSHRQKCVVLVVGLFPQFGFVRWEGISSRSMFSVDALGSQDMMFVSSWEERNQVFFETRAFKWNDYRNPFRCSLAQSKQDRTMHLNESPHHPPSPIHKHGSSARSLRPPTYSHPASSHPRRPHSSTLPRSACSS